MRPSLCILTCLLCGSLWLTACQSSDQDEHATAIAAVTPPGEQKLIQVPRPHSIEAAIKDRGEQDLAQPVLRIVTPVNNAIIHGPTVELRLELSGELKGYGPHKDPSTQKGNHIHVILDNEPYEAYYELNQPFELRNVSSGKHTLRVFPSRPWHESYKNQGAFQMVEFTVAGGGETTKQTTTSSGEKNGNPPANREGKDFGISQGGSVDRTKPLLTYSRPKGEYKGADADAIMIDFWLLNAKLTGDGGDYRVRYSIDFGEPRFLERWEPIWLSGWISGKHTVKLELVDKNGEVIDNGEYNSTTRDIVVSR